MIQDARRFIRPMTRQDELSRESSQGQSSFDVAIRQEFGVARRASNEHDKQTSEY